MNYKLKLFLYILNLVFLIRVANSVRKERLQLKYALVWMGVFSGFFIATFFHEYIFKLINFIGIIEPLNGLLFIALIILASIVFGLTAAYSKTTLQIKNLTQEIGIIKNKIEELKND